MSNLHANFHESIQLVVETERTMGRRTSFLAGTMIFWLPVLFLTTYAGFYEAYTVAMENEFLGLRYPDDFATLLIIPAMIPTIFSAHAIINREKMTVNLIEKFNLFHSRAEDGNSIDLEETLLTTKEYDKLDFVKQLEYCKDLRDVGKPILANKYLDQYFDKYSSSQSTIERASALYSRTLVSDGSVSQKEMFESSEMAYQLISEFPDSVLFHRVVFAHVIELTYLGYETGLERLREIEKTVSDNYLSVLIDVRKLYFLYRMDRISDIDFTSIEEEIDFTSLEQHQLDQLERQISKIKNEVLLDNGEFEQLELHLHQRRYREKWSGLQSGALQNSFGRMYRKMGDYEMSLKYFNADLTSSRSKNLPYDEGVALVNLGKTYFLMENYTQVMQYSKQAFEVFTKIDLARGLIESLTLFVNASDALGEECHQEREELQLLEKENGIVAQTS